MPTPLGPALLCFQVMNMASPPTLTPQGQLISLLLSFIVVHFAVLCVLCACIWVHVCAQLYGSVCVEARGYSLMSALTILHLVCWLKWLCPVLSQSYMASAELQSSSGHANYLNFIWFLPIREIINDSIQKWWEGQWERRWLYGILHPIITWTVIITPVSLDLHHSFWKNTGVLCKFYTCGKLVKNFPFLSFS